MMVKIFILLLSTISFVASNYESSEATISTTSKVTKVDSDQINWRDGDNGQVKWAQYCDFDGNEILNKQIRSEDCGLVCLEKSNCVTFSWTYAEGGTCYLKDGGVARYTSDTPVCGKVLSRKTQSRIEKDDTDYRDIKWLSKCAHTFHSKQKAVTLSGLWGPIGALYDLALSKADRIIAGIERFNTCPAANECKFNITYHGKGGTKNGLRSEWITYVGDVNSNDEYLDGLGHQVDTAQERIDGRLSLIKFTPYGEPCVKTITIACGDKVVPGTGYIKITHEHMKVALDSSNYRHIETDTDHNCVRFSNRQPENSFTKMVIDSSIFECQVDDQQCITSHFETF